MSPSKISRKKTGTPSDLGPFSITSTEGKSFEFELPKPADCVSFFAFAFHKSGSTLMNNMLSDALVETGIPVVDLYAEAFRNGVQTSLLDSSADRALRPRGYAYLGLRHFFPFKSEFDFKPVKKILLVRDPRDMAVSMYFSQKFSHETPQDDEKFVRLRQRMQEGDIADFLVKEQTVKHYVARSQAYFDRCPRQNLRVYRYEDVIYRKEEWLKDMLAFLEFDIGDERIHEIAEKNDVRPTDEQPDRHIRQVAPGNYKKHLTDDVIEYLDDRFATMLKQFGYAPPVVNPEIHWRRVLSCLPEPVFNVTYPRSGNTLLIRILKRYFGAMVFNPLPMRMFHEYFESVAPEEPTPEQDQPCVKCDRAWDGLEEAGFNWVKHHDFGLVASPVPGLPMASPGGALIPDPERTYLIQYRHPLASAASFYDHQLAEGLLSKRSRLMQWWPARGSQKQWREFCSGAIGYWEQFCLKWALNDDITNKKVVRYETLVENLFEVSREIIQFATGDPIIDEAKLRTITGPEQRDSTRSIRKFRFFDEAFFREQEARVLPLFEKLNLTPLFN
jgi:hypothetical protein